MKVYEYKYGADKASIKFAVGLAFIWTGFWLIILTLLALMSMVGEGRPFSLSDCFFFFFLCAIVWVFPAYVWYKYRLTKDESEPQLRLVMELLPDRLLVYSSFTGKIKKEIFYSDLELFHFHYSSHDTSGDNFHSTSKFYYFKYKKKSEKEGKDISPSSLYWSENYWSEENGQKIEGYSLAQAILDFVHERMGMTFDYPTIDWAQVGQLKMKFSKETLPRQLMDSVTKLFHQGESVRSEVYAIITPDGIDKADLLTQSIKHYSPSEMKNLTVDWGEAVFDYDHHDGSHLLPRIAFLYDDTNKELNVKENMYFELDDGTQFIPQTNEQLADLRKGIFKLLGAESL